MKKRNVTIVCMALLGGLSSACSTVATPESNDQEIGLLMARDDNVAISKKLQLESLLQEYSQDKITPAEYQARRVAIIGKNGSGKSSILKLINGDDIKFTGNFMLASGLKISYISQDTSYLKGNLSEFAYNNKIDETLFKTILRKLDFNREQFDKNMVDFSAGQKKKVLIAKSLCESAHLYIWDEPLNYIDIFSRIQIEKMILEYCPTLLFVEHDDAFCNNICTKNINLGL